MTTLQPTANAADLPAPAAPATPAIPARTWIAVVGATLGAFMAVLNIQIVNASLAEAGRGLPKARAARPLGVAWWRMGLAALGFWCARRSSGGRCISSGPARMARGVASVAVLAL